MEVIIRQKMASALEEERRTNQIQREFVSMVSHEFRTPLAIIDGTAQRLIRRKNKLTSEEVEERAGRIRNAVTRMTDLIADTLCATQLDAGNIEFSPTVCQLADLIGTVCQTQREMNPSHRITFDPGLVPESMIADPRLLEQIFVNLVSNAIKYSPDGSRVEVCGGCEGQFVTVTVRDNGIGIPSKDMPRLFERYFRASNTTGIPGTGIGLHLVKWLVEMHGGTVTVQSADGQGTTITVRMSNTLTAAGRNNVASNKLAIMAN